MENLWNKERQLYAEQIQTFEQSLIESKKKAIDQETKIMQLTVQLESSDGQFQAQVCSHQQKTKIINDDDDFRNVRLIQVSKKKINQFSISIDN